MWETPAGTRTLAGSEAELVRQLLGYVFYQIDVVCREIDEAYSIGIAVFDRLSNAQQLALLAEVGEALLLDQKEPSNLSAIREATVAVLFEELHSCIESEIEAEQLDGPPSHYWRSLIRQTVWEQLPEDRPLSPTPESRDLKEWAFLIECLAGRILWDDDWEIESQFVAAPPETNQLLKTRLGIDDDYFIDIAPDPTPDQLHSVRARLVNWAPSANRLGNWPCNASRRRDQQSLHLRHRDAIGTVVQRLVQHKAGSFNSQGWLHAASVWPVEFGRLPHDRTLEPADGLLELRFEMCVA